MDERQANITPLEPWAEPEISVLDIEETHIFPGRGRDGETHADCTRS